MILLTGATGYIGGNLLKRLLLEGYPVTALVRPGSDCSQLTVPTLVFDGRSSTLHDFFSQHDISAVIHVAAAFDAGQPGTAEQLIESNLKLGTLLLEAMEVNGCRIFLNTGTFSQHQDTSEYNPRTLYDATKQSFEAILDYYAIAHGFQIVTLKLTDVYGADDKRPKIFQLLLQAIATNEPLKVTKGEQLTRLTYIDDVCSAYLKVLENIPTGLPGHKTYFVGAPENSLPVREAIELYQTGMGLSVPLIWGGRAYHPREIMQPYFGKTIEGWKPEVSVADGIKKVVTSHKQRLAEGNVVTATATHPVEPKKLISFVVPVYNEEENIPEFFRQINAFISKHSRQFDFEIVVTDNHSTDRTTQLLAEEAARNPHLKVFRFSRNFGHQRSLLTGYQKCRGDAAVQLDCDLQDPLHVVEDFFVKWAEGYKVVYGIRKVRQEGAVITSVRKVFYRLLDALSEFPIPKDVGDFRLIDRAVLDVLVKCQDRNPYIRGYLAEIGFSQIGIEYARNARIAGESKFKVRDLLVLALDGIANHSTTPLRLASFTGLFISLCTLLLIVGYSVAKIWFGAKWPAGFTTLTVLVLFSISLNALFLGIIGEYLGRIFKQSKASPLTIIEAEFSQKDFPSSASLLPADPAKPSMFQVKSRMNEPVI